MALTSPEVHRATLTEALRSAPTLDGVNVYDAAGGSISPPALWVAQGADFMTRTGGERYTVSLEVVLLAGRGEDSRAVAALERLIGLVLPVITGVPTMAWQRVDGAIPVTVAGVTYLATTVDVFGDA